MVAVTFLLAFITWFFVELPFRRKIVLPQASLFKAALACSLSCIAVGIAGQKTYGFINRSAGAEVYLSWADKTRINYGLHADCDSQSSDPGLCQTSTSPEILVWGDSYAMHLVPGILSANPAASLVQMTASSCAPFLSIAVIQSGYAPQSCLDFNRQVTSRIAQFPSLEFAVLSSPFSRYFSGNSSVLMAEGQTVTANEELVDREFRKTLEFLIEQGITPVIFSPTPGNDGANIGRCLGRADYFSRSLSDCNFPLENNSEELQRVFAWLKRLSEEFPVVFLDELLCPDGICQAHSDGTYYYRDSGHLAIAGSGALGKQADFYTLIAGGEKAAIAQSR